MKKFSNKSSLIIESLRPQQKQETPQINEELVSHISDEVKRRIIIEQAYLEEQRFRKLKDFLGGLFSRGKADDAASAAGKTDDAAADAAREAAEKAAKEKAAKEAAAKADDAGDSGVAGKIGPEGKVETPSTPSTTGTRAGDIATKVDDKAGEVADEMSAAADGSGDVLDTLAQRGRRVADTLVGKPVRKTANVLDKVKTGANIALDFGKDMAGAVDKMAAAGKKGAGTAKKVTDLLFGKPKRPDQSYAGRFAGRLGRVAGAGEIIQPAADYLGADLESTFGPTFFQSAINAKAAKDEGKSLGDTILQTGEDMGKRALGLSIFSRPGALFGLGSAAVGSVEQGGMGTYLKDKAFDFDPTGLVPKSWEGRPGGFSQQLGARSPSGPPMTRAEFDTKADEMGRFADSEERDAAWEKYKEFVDSGAWRKSVTQGRTENNQ